MYDDIHVYVVHIYASLSVDILSIMLKDQSDSWLTKQ